MSAEIVDDKVMLKDQSLVSKLYEKGFGKLVNNGLELSLLEALFLLERDSITISKNDKALTPEDILKRVDEDEFMLRYRVFKDLRERGYIAKSGFKFGAHFRVYKRGEYENAHSVYLVHAVKEGDTLSFSELSRAIRLSQSVKKDMIFAVVDDEGDVTYYSVDRITP
ncbi:MAG: tRNA-intron lyase [Candidatus Hydrothermarchaeales archaeon]